MTLSFPGKIEELSELELTHHADSANLSSSGNLSGLGHAHFGYKSKYRYG